jgi:hypothetical protein
VSFEHFGDPTGRGQVKSWCGRWTEYYCIHGMLSLELRRHHLGHSIICLTK